MMLRIMILRRGKTMMLKLEDDEVQDKCNKNIERKKY